MPKVIDLDEDTSFEQLKSLPVAKRLYGGLILVHNNPDGGDAQLQKVIVEIEGKQYHPVATVVDYRKRQKYYGVYAFHETDEGKRILGTFAVNEIVSIEGALAHCLIMGMLGSVYEEHFILRFWHGSGSNMSRTPILREMLRVPIPGIRAIIHASPFVNWISVPMTRMLCMLNPPVPIRCFRKERELDVFVSGLDLRQKRKGSASMRSHPGTWKRMTEFNSRYEDTIALDDVVRWRRVFGVPDNHSVYSTGSTPSSGSSKAARLSDDVVRWRGVFGVPENHPVYSIGSTSSTGSSKAARLSGEYQIVLNGQRVIEKPERFAKMQMETICEEDDQSSGDF